VCQIAGEEQVSQNFWSDLAEKLDNAVLDDWNAMSPDPLVAKPGLLVRKKRAARYDRAILATLVDAVSAGPSAFAIAQRATSLCRAKRPPSATRLEENKVCAYVSSTKETLSKEPWPLQLAMAIDASRRGGFKVLLGCCYNAATMHTWWAVPQNLRDFKGALQHNCILDASFSQLVALGTQALNSILVSGVAASEIQQPSKRFRLAAYDLGIALENMLHQMGHSLSTFGFDS
jgi:hypothetical protein